MRERLSRRALIKRAAILGGEAALVSLGKKARIGQSHLNQERAQAAEQLRAKLGIQGDSLGQIEEPPVLTPETVETPQLADVEEPSPPQPEIIEKPNWPKEVLLRSTR